MNVRLATPRILHLHASFDPGAKEVRCARLMNAWGKDADHAIVSGDHDKRGAARLIGSKVRVTWPKFPSLTGKPTPGRLKNIAAAMSGYDLICTYNWGAMDATMAHTLFADVYNLPPLMHHEDGFDEEEAQRLKRRRNLFRRIALGRTAALVVPSRNLERIALETWDQPRTRVQLIPNGIDTRAFSAPPKRDLLPDLVKHRGEFWVGSLAGLREEKNLDSLVLAMRSLPEEWQLVIAGEGPERENLLALAEEQGLEDRVHLPGRVEHPEKLVGLFDIFALSSLSEQFPMTVVEAMAAGLPIVAPRAGDIPATVSSDNGPLLVDPGDEKALGKNLWRLSQEAKERKRIGHANREKARRDYDALAMVERYRALYWGLMNRARGS